MPADAVINREYDLRSAWNGNGSTRAWGDITWYGKSKFVISGRVNDRCPADLHGAYFWVDVWFKDGTWKGRLVKKDAGGCRDRNGEAFSTTFNPRKRIRCARLFAYEVRPATSDVNDVKAVNKDNPYTRNSRVYTPCDL